MKVAEMPDAWRVDEAMDIITHQLEVKPEEITNVQILKKGMTNRSFRFDCQDKHYIMRVPGEGTEQLINRKQEYEVYQKLTGQNICDAIIYINPDNGFKITKYYENARVCNADDKQDLEKCMDKLRQFHNLKLEVAHEFDIYGQMEFYETLWKGVPSVYSDYRQVKEQVLSLRSYIEHHVERKILTHIDANADNFLIYENARGGQSVRLIDWEYAGMQDPHVDIAMFCIYSMYDRPQVERLIDIYFQGNCNPEIRIKIYCYIAACGLLWSNWCEYKRHLGVEFGEYALKQYQYAGEYYKIAKEEMGRIG